MDDETIANRVRKAVLFRREREDDYRYEWKHQHGHSKARWYGGPEIVAMLPRERARVKALRRVGGIPVHKSMLELLVRYYHEEPKGPARKK
jgi:hypothetical protein